ncbi:MAG: hypothetical protein ACREMW_01630 [Gemmatimonadales bacterium]
MPKPRIFLFTVVGLLLIGTPLSAQGSPKRYKVSTDRATVATREVLVRRGFEVIRIEERGVDRIVWYRQGNMGRGKGKGPPLKLVIRRDVDRVVFLEAPPAILVDIDVRLRLP